MKHHLILLGILYVCAADEYHGPVEPPSVEGKQDDEELNSVDEDPNQLNLKLIPYPANKISSFDQAGSEILTTKVIPEQTSENSDTSALSFSTPTAENVPVEDQKKPSTDYDVDLLLSTTKPFYGASNGEPDSKLSDIPADKPSVSPDEVTEQAVGSSEYFTYATSYSDHSNPITQDYLSSNTNSEIASDSSSSTTPESILIDQSETVQPGIVYTPGRSTVRPKIDTTTVTYSEASEPGSSELTTEVIYNEDDMNRRKTTSAATTTQKTPEHDTPPYPPLPSIPTDEEGILLPRPPIRRGQLDIRISIPHIFHLSLGDTPDGHRRLGIQAPFFKFDLTKSRLKVFQK